MKLAEKVLELIERSAMFDQPDYTVKLHPNASNAAAIDLSRVYDKLLGIELEFESLVDKPKGHDKVKAQLTKLMNHVWSAKLEAMSFTKTLKKLVKN